MAVEIASLLNDILTQLGGLSAPYLKVVFCFNRKKGELEQTMERIKENLQEAEQQPQKRYNKQLLGELQYILYDAEDFVEEVSLIEVQHPNRKMAGKLICFFSTLRFQVAMAFRMKKIGDRLKEVEENFKKYYEPQAQQDSNQEMREPQCYVPADMFIGRDGDKTNIKELLVKASTEKNVSIFPIYGIGGLGKTTLARSVYDDIGKDYFEVKVWAWASSTADDFDVKAIVKKLIESHTKDECRVTDMNQLGDRLRNTVNGKKYLLVLDDVWNTDREKWHALEVGKSVNGWCKWKCNSRNYTH